MSVGGKWVSISIVGVVLLALIAVYAIAPVLRAEAADQPGPPDVEVWAPDIYPSGAAFEVRASAIGCDPRRWAWTLPTGCVAVQPSTIWHVQVRCMATSGVASFTLHATAQGGGCGGVFGTASVVVTSAAPALISLPICDSDSDGATPSPVITIPPAGIYYRPGLQSTGRLNLRVGDRTVRANVQCVEPISPTN